MPDGDEKRRLLDCYRAGEWYEHLADAAGVDYESRSELKRQAQMQLLFFDSRWPATHRPLWRQGLANFPGFRSLILRLRKQHGGPSGFSDWLTAKEQAVMSRVHDRIARAGGRYLPLHDAVLVPQSAASRVQGDLIEAGAQALGFEPLATVK